MIKVFRSRLLLKMFSATAVALGALFAGLHHFTVPLVQEVMQAAEETAGRTILDNVYQIVAKSRDELRHHEKAALEQRQKALKDIVLVAESALRRLIDRAVAGGMEPAAAKARALEELRRFQYGNKDYIWAADEGSRLVSHPDPGLHGTDASQLRDLHGKPVVAPMVEKGMREGEGFHSYWWNRLGHTRSSEKLSYFKHLPDLGLILGTGLYLDDLQQSVEWNRELVVAELRHDLKKIRVAGGGYLYVFDSSGLVVIHPNPNLEGGNLVERRNPVTGGSLGEELKAAVGSPAGWRYKWDRPEDPGHYVHDKIAWVRYFPDFDWYVAASVYLDDLHAGSRILARRLLLIIAVASLAGVVVVYFLIEHITAPIRELSRTARRVAEGDLAARSAIRREDEIGVLSGAFNGMVDRLQENIRTLDDKVRERTGDLERAYGELQQLDRLKSQFLSNVSHELRTPITSIVGFARLMARKLEGVEEALAPDSLKARRNVRQVRENAAIVESEAARLAGHVTHLMDLAQMDAGRLVWREGEVVLGEVVERVVGEWAPRAAAKGLELVVEVGEGLPILRGDGERLGQVVGHLVDNAITFTDTGRVEVVVRRGGEGVRLEVRDTGPGIAREEVTAIFDSFRQGGELMTGKPRGVGLGLPLCRRIVDHHGGRIGVESRLGEGSCFYVELPAPA